MDYTEVSREKKIHKTQMGLVSFKFNSLSRMMWIIQKLERRKYIKHKSVH
jgi:hypothetical protein